MVDSEQGHFTIRGSDPQEAFTQCLKASFGSKTYSDVEIRCLRNDVTNNLNAHSCVLAAISPILKDLIAANRADLSDGEASTTICLPDTDFQIVQLVVRFAYTGDITVPKNRVDELFELVHRLKIRYLQNVVVKVNKAKETKTKATEAEIVKAAGAKARAEAGDSDTDSADSGDRGDQVVTSEDAGEEGRRLFFFFLNFVANWPTGLDMVQSEGRRQAPHAEMHRGYKKRTLGENSCSVLCILAESILSLSPFPDLMCANRSAAVKGPFFTSGHFE